MVTDERGYPLEFRATTPVKPSLIQRAIYGDQLETYVGQELLAATLLRDSDLTPSVVVTTELSLEGIRTPSGCPVVRLREAVDDIVVTSERRGALELNNRGRQLIYYVDPEGEAAAVEALGVSAEHFDLIATFDRMRAALEILEREDERFR